MLSKNFQLKFKLLSTLLLHNYGPVIKTCKFKKCSSAFFPSSSSSSFSFLCAFAFVLIF